MIPGLRSHTKPNPLRRAIIGMPPDLKRMAYFWGQIGSGKSLAKRSLIEKYHDNLGYKVLIIWGGDRNEHLYWTLPSHKKSYWEKIKRLMNLKEEGAKQYKVNLLYPMSKNTIRDNLPQLKVNGNIVVDSKIFTIPINDIEIDDIALCIGNGTQANANQTQSVWRDSKDKMSKKDNGANLTKYVTEEDGLKTTLYKNFIKPLVDHRLLSSEDSPYNLDLAEEFSDRETISVFCLDLIEKEYRLFIMGWIFRQLTKMIMNKEAYHKNIISIEESAEFFRATDDSVINETYKIFRGRITHYARMGRTGTYLFLDAQSPKETKGIIEGNEDIAIIGRLTGENDKETLLRQYDRTGQIKSEHWKDIGLLKPGEYYLIAGMKDARKVYFFLPRSSYWEEGDGTFYDYIWKKRVNTWKNMKEDIEKIETDFQKRREEIIQQEKIDEAIRQKEEEEKNLIRLEAEKKQIQMKAEITEEARLIGRQNARKKVNPALNTPGGTRTADTSTPKAQDVTEEEDFDLEL